MKKSDIITLLKQRAREISKSPGRREFSYKFYRSCVSNFGSFNKAKLKADLKIYQRVCPSLPKNAFVLDTDLVRIVSFLTFDGHLHKDLKGFLLGSKNTQILEEFKRLVYKKFGLFGVYCENGRGDERWGECQQYRIFNSNASKFLHSLGTPKGDKVVTSFDIPGWIKQNKMFARDYLRICFLCEGCKYYAGNRERIQINLNKCEELLDTGIQFMDSLKYLLSLFDIETTITSIKKGNIRNKDGKTTKTMRFEIRSKSVNTFIKTIGWFKS